MGVESGIYKVLLVLHILSAIIGFGGVMLNGLYGAQAKKRKGTEGLAVLESTIGVSKVAQKFIYAVFVFGLLLIVTSDETWKFSQLWLSASMGLYIVAVGISHAVVAKNVGRMRDLMAEMAAGPPPAGGPPPQAAEMERRGKTVAAASMVLDVILVTILVLMVWKPL
ncbi:MAG TPA: DUF2269 family protein [Acidimicrobiales bacterium]|nr:DUF2269 family protein [Acidimicrobiales bacterium]